MLWMEGYCAPKLCGLAADAMASLRTTAAESAESFPETACCDLFFFVYDNDVLWLGNY